MWCVLAFGGLWVSLWARSPQPPSRLPVTGSLRAPLSRASTTEAAHTAPSSQALSPRYECAVLQPMHLFL